MLRKLFQKLKKKIIKQALKPTPIDGELSSLMPLRYVVINIGHGYGDDGASNDFITEHAYVSKVGENVKRVLREAYPALAVDVNYRGKGGISEQAMRARENNPDFIIELHCNDADNLSANGFEILVLPNQPLSAKLARHFINEFKNHFPTRKLRRDAGVYWLNDGQDGTYSLTQLTKTGIPAILLEGFFIRNLDDFIPSHLYVNFLVRAILDFKQFEKEERYV